MRDDGCGMTDARMQMQMRVRGRDVRVTDAG
jgi:hypothetical protein